MSQSHMKTIGKRIREARLQRGHTQESLAKAVGKSKQLVSAWEAGRAEILASKLADTARALAADVNWILYGHKGAASLVHMPEGTIISKLETDDIRALAKGRLVLSKVEKRFVIHGAVSSKAFAVVAPDEGLAPCIRRGDFVTIDPTVPIEPGMLGLAVVFADKGSSLPSAVILIREFWFKTLARDSHFELVAKRAGYPNIEVENRKEAVIVGAVVGIQKVGVVGTDQS